MEVYLFYNFILGTQFLSPENNHILYILKYLQKLYHPEIYNFEYSFSQ